MWRLVLSVGLLCWRSEGSVTCRDVNSGSVDWYILYKAPAGLKYRYIDSTGMHSSSDQNINHPNGVLANSLRPLFTPIRSMPDNFGFISYSDQPPGCQAGKDFGHTKGVVMVEMGPDQTSSGLWLLHSTPQFPYRRDQNHFWPPSGLKKAQMFLCITFPYSQFRNIGKHLQYIGAFPFEHDIPNHFHQELQDAANWVKSPPPTHSTPLTSLGQTGFLSFAKQQSDEPTVGDLYVTIAQELQSDLKVQTWGCQPGRDESFCETGRYKVKNIKHIKVGSVTWTSKVDHSKWCVATDQNKPWTCVADVNRAVTQYQRRGGALCISNAFIHNIVLEFAAKIEECGSPNILDLLNTECEPETDSD
ncbi:deoxyribonuclease-2-alpha-like isoform 1-T3 [Acanthopagrus schlegelii]